MSTPRHLDNLRKIFLHGVSCVQPSALFANKVVITRNSDGDEVLQVANKAFNISNKKCHLVGFGKAVLGMAVQLDGVLGADRLVSGSVSVPVGSVDQFRKAHNFRNSVIQIFEGASNNLPDAKAMAAALHIRDVAKGMSQDDVLFVLISGGGSALLPIPRHPLTLQEKLAIVKQLGSAGASIDELNLVRIALSDSKGGRLAEAAKRASAVVSFVISDIVNDPIELIASGPTVVRSSGSGDGGIDAKRILEKYAIWDSLGEHIKSLFGEKSEEDTLRPNRTNSHIFVIGSNKIASEGCFAEAKNLGYIPVMLTTSLQGNIHHITDMYKTFLESIINFKNSKISEDEFLKNYPFDKSSFPSLVYAVKLSQTDCTPLCLILGGEITVNIKGKGRGGRSQELALRMSLELNNNPLLKDIHFLSAGTDGIDGPTPAAGAIGCKEVVEEFLRTQDENRIKTLLEDNDSFNFYTTLSDGKYHVITGHTGTNVMDLHLVVVP